MVNRVASDALQIHGANGCGPDLPLERYFRDARIMEIIEGTSQILEGTIANEENRHDVAIAHFQSAVRLEDKLTYDEPPPWYHSVRNLLGEALLEAGRAADAEQAFREDLRFVRETGWTLDGLARALRAQGRNTEADALAERLSRAWQYADVALPRKR